MQPIVNPWFFYLLYVADALNEVMFLVCLLAATVACASILYYLFEDSSEYKYKSLSIKSIIVFILSFLFFILLPPKRTLIEMYVAKNVTYERVEKLKDTASNLHKAIIEDIIKLIEATHKQNEKEEK